MGDRSFHFCLLHTVIVLWRGIFWLKWQGTNWTKWQENKLAWMAGQKISLKETSRGTKCVKQTNNINKGAWLFFPIGATHRHLINRPSMPMKMLAQQRLLYGGCQWVQIIALNLNFPLKFIRVISSCWIKHEKESKKIGRVRSIYSWSRELPSWWIRPSLLWNFFLSCCVSG